MRTTVFTAAAYLASLASAVKVLTPTKGQTVDLSAGVEVTFETVSTDPTTADLVLVNMAGGNTPFSFNIGPVDLEKGTFVVLDDVDVPPQKGYQFNVVSASKDNTGILAQSEQFEVVEAVGAGSKDKTTSAGEEKKSTKTGAASTASTAAGTAEVSGTSTFATVTASSTGSTTATGTATASSTAGAGSVSEVVEAAAATGRAVAGGSLLALAVAGFVAVVA